VKNGKTIESIVEGRVMDFENGEKRIFDIANKNQGIDPIWIDDLKPNLKKRFHQNRFEISR